MSIKVFDEYTPRANVPDGNYPTGSIKNESVPGSSDDGTPLDQNWGNDILGFRDALLLEANITASGNPDTAVTSDALDSVKDISRFESIAPGLNVPSSQVIKSTDTTTVLNNIEYIRDVVGQKTWAKPNDVGAGETILTVSGSVLTTNVTTYTLKPADRVIVNRFKGNQNFNAEGRTGDPLPSAAPTLYTVGAELSIDYFVVTANLVNCTRVAGVINADSGFIQRKYPKDDGGLISIDTEFAFIVNHLGALITTGVILTEDATDIIVTVNLSLLVNGFQYMQLSAEKGRSAPINDSESIDNIYVNLLKSRTWGVASRTVSVTYENTTAVDLNIHISWSTPASAGLAVTLFVDGIPVSVMQSVSVGAYISTINATVPPGVEYEFTTIGSPTTTVHELRV